MNLAKNLSRLALIGTMLTSFNVMSAELEGLTLYAGIGQNSGDVAFRESVPGVSQSILKFEPDGEYISLGGRYQFVNTSLPRASVSVSGIVARNYEDNSTTDTDLATGISNNPFILSKSDQTGGNQEVFDINFGYRILGDEGDKLTLDALLGYYSNRYEFEVSNVNTLIYDYTPVNWLTVGEAAEYEIEFQGFYAGGAVHFMPIDKLHLKAMLKFIPQIEANGVGKWKLRDLTFDHNGEGNGFEMQLGACFKPGEHWAIGVNVTMTDMDADGRSKNYTISTNTNLGQNDLEIVEIDTLSAEVRAGYYF